MTSEMVACTKCGNRLMATEENFYRRNNRTLHKQCKSCIRAAVRLNRATNRETVLRNERRSGARYRNKNREKCRAFCAQYRLNHPERQRHSEEKYRANNRERVRESNRAYRERNKFEINFKSTIGQQLRAIGKAMPSNIFDSLPYSLQDLKSYIEAQFETWMTFANQGLYDPQTWDDSKSETWTWHLDHIVPKSRFTFDDVSDEGFQSCWALSNLRPYSSKLNIVEYTR